MNRIQVEPYIQDSMNQKEAYKTPEVTTFGSVAKLTLGGSGTRPDGQHNTGGNHGQG